MTCKLAPTLPHALPVGTVTWTPRQARFVSMQAHAYRCLRLGGCGKCGFLVWKSSSTVLWVQQQGSTQVD